MYACIYYQDLSVFLIKSSAYVCVYSLVTGIMALGYIAAFDEALALCVIASNGLPPLLHALINELEDHIKSATAWTIGQIGRHTPNHAKSVAEAGILPQLVLAFISKTSSEDLQNKCKKAIKGICDRLTYFPALDSFIHVKPKLLMLTCNINSLANGSVLCSLRCSYFVLPGTCSS